MRLTKVGADNEVTCISSHDAASLEQRILGFGFGIDLLLTLHRLLKILKHNHAIEPFTETNM